MEKGRKPSKLSITLDFRGCGGWKPPKPSITFDFRGCWELWREVKTQGGWKPPTNQASCSILGVVEGGWSPGRLKTPKTKHCAWFWGLLRKVEAQGDQNPSKPSIVLDFGGCCKGNPSRSCSPFCLPLTFRSSSRFAPWCAYHSWPATASNLPPASAALACHVAWYLTRTDTYLLISVLFIISVTLYISPYPQGILILSSLDPLLGMFMFRLVLHNNLNPFGSPASTALMSPSLS